MTLVRALALSLLLAPALLAGEEAPPPVAPVVDGNTAFACDLYARLRTADGNLFLSPYSISTCLAMTREGAAGNTAVEMDRVLHFPGADLGRGLQGLERALVAPMVRDGYGREARQVPAYEIEVANRLFGQRGYHFRAPFLKQLETVYGAALEQLDIHADPAAARARINGWVEEQTRNRIKDLLPPSSPSPDSRLVLVNAIYFKSAWDEPFNERGTEDAPFHRADGTDVGARIMRRTHRFRYAEDGDVQVLDMPYRGGALSMLVVLPRTREGLSAVEQRLTPAVLKGWVDALEGRKVAVRFPRFEYASTFDLTNTLGAMGMADAFSATRADFSGMTESEPLFIGLVVHKAFVKVNEEGTEAAAATAVDMRAGAAPRPEEPVRFDADRPFLFLIRHRTTGAVLFLGRVVDPS